MRDLRRRYREPLIRLLIKLFSRMPFSLALFIGGVFGRILWLFNGEMRKTSERNVSICLPGLSEAEKKRIVKSSLIETGKNITEIATLWTKPRSRMTALVTNVHGESVLTEALGRGQGVILLAPHLGAWEMSGLYVSLNFPITSMYKPPEMQSLEDIVRAGRSRFGAKLVPTDVTGVRELLHALKKGEVIGILPDQDPGRGNGEFAPFFGQSANTATLAIKLAAKTNAKVISCYAKRNKDASGYEVYFYPCDQNVNHSDADLALAAMNKEVEKLILRCPEQYQWNYKRFKTQPNGLKTIYQ